MPKRQSKKARKAMQQTRANYLRTLIADTFVCPMCGGGLQKSFPDRPMRVADVECTNYEGNCPFVMRYVEGTGETRKHWSVKKLGK
jgi:hypothetical protein